MNYYNPILSQFSIPLAPKLCLGVYIRTQESIQLKKKSKLYSLLLIHPHSQATNYIYLFLIHSYTLPNTVWERGKDEIANAKRLLA